MICVNGLPEGQMGNSEVGHITIGAGRVVNQFLRRFQIENWDENKKLNHFIQSVKNNGEGTITIVKGQGGYTAAFSPLRSEGE